MSKDEEIKEDRDLKWKAHGAAFVSLNERVDTISKLFIMASGNVRVVHTVYLCMRGIYQKNSHYFGENKDNILKDLSKCRKGLQDIKYTYDVNEYFRTDVYKKDQNLKRRILIYENKILDGLDVIFTLMNEKLSQSEMFPKVNITKTIKQNNQTKGATV